MVVVGHVVGGVGLGLGRAGGVGVLGCSFVVALDNQPSRVPLLRGLSVPRSEVQMQVYTLADCEHLGNTSKNCILHVVQQQNCIRPQLP